MAELQRVDLISLFDIDFKRARLTTSDLRRIEKVSERESQLLKNFSDSYSWVFQWDNSDENALPGMVRYGLAVFAKGCGLKDAYLLVSPQLGVGVLCMQHNTEGIHNIPRAIEFKRENYKAWQVARRFFQLLETKCPKHGKPSLRTLQTRSVTLTTSSGSSNHAGSACNEFEP